MNLRRSTAVTIVFLACFAPPALSRGAVPPPPRIGEALPQELESPRCGDTGPEEIYPVTLSKLPDHGVRLVWIPWGIYNTDIVRGSLTALSATDGDFTIATQECVMDDTPGVQFDDPAVPSVGEGFWYLLRADARQPFPGGCPMGQGTYNMRQYGVPSHQVGNRNLEIKMSGRECSCSFFPTDSASCTVWYYP